MSRRRKPATVSSLSLGDYLRWLASTMSAERLVVDELTRRAGVADDLLEVAKSLLDAQRYAKSIRDYHEALDNVKHLARAAIAKAEGGGR